MLGQSLSKKQIEILKQRIDDDKRHFDAKKRLNQAIFEETLKRKPVQIAGTSGGLYALCNDGTVWVRSYDTDGTEGWEQFPPIPQPEEE